MPWPVSENGLTLKQERFAQNYVMMHGNGTKAAIEAGYSEPCAHVQAHENLRKPKIQDRIAEWLDSAVTGDDVTPEMILGRLVHEAKNAETDGARVRAIELLGKYHAMWIDRQQNEQDDVDAQTAVNALVADPEMLAEIITGALEDPTARAVIKQCVEAAE